MSDAKTRVGAGPPERVTPYACYVLFMLVLCNTLNYFDRQIIYIVFESLKHEFKLSDSQLGLLVGFGFSIASATCALALAWVADRVSRVWVISGCLFFWSLMTSLGGVAQNYTQLLLTRMGVAVGEAGCTPPSYAIMSDIFPAHRRATAISFYALATPLAALLALSLGGWLNDAIGWRHTLIAMGIPGVVIAVIMLATLKGPHMQPSAATKVLVARTPARTVIFTFLRDAAFRNTVIGCVLATIALSGVGSFSGAFLIRTQGLTATQAGLALGLISGVGGIVGALMSGVLTDWAVRKGANRVYVPTIFFGLLVTPLLIGAWLAPTAGMTIAFLILPAMATYLFVTPSMVVLQLLAPPQYRALAVATYTTFVGLIGSGGGPTLVGLFSDLFHAHGVNSLRYALGLMIIPQLWAMIHFGLATRALSRHGSSNRQVTFGGGPDISAPPVSPA